jgi:hypothetical protein
VLCCCTEQNPTRDGVRFRSYARRGYWPESATRKSKTGHSAFEANELTYNETYYVARPPTQKDD